MLNCDIFETTCTLFQLRDIFSLPLTKMKSSWLRWSLLSLLAVPALGTPSDASPDQESGDILVKRWGELVDSDQPTTFNGVEVPPLTQLTPENFEEVTKGGYW